MHRCEACGTLLLDFEYNYCSDCEDALADDGYWEGEWYYEDEGWEE